MHACLCFGQFIQKSAFSLTADTVSCIYGRGIKDLGIVVLYIQQQELDTVDCGVFAIANIVEFCISGYNELEIQSRLWNFDMANCRKHLVTCLKSKKFIPFPKISQPNKIKMDMDRFFQYSLYVLVAFPGLTKIKIFLIEKIRFFWKSGT